MSNKKITSHRHLPLLKMITVHQESRTHTFKKTVWSIHSLPFIWRVVFKSQKAEVYYKDMELTMPALMSLGQRAHIRTLCSSCDWNVPAAKRRPVIFYVSFEISPLHFSSHLYPCSTSSLTSIYTPLPCLWRLLVSFFFLVYLLNKYLLFFCHISLPEIILLSSETEHKAKLRIQFSCFG
jgi:hypothetical protein